MARSNHSFSRAGYLAQKFLASRVAEARVVEQLNRPAHIHLHSS